MGEKVAFIGLGAMGGPMALNIIKKGTSVSVFDIETKKMELISRLVEFQVNQFKILLKMPKLL